MLDLVIRNEDRLPCRYLRWRGNSANLLLADKMATSNRDALEEAFDSAISRYRPRVIRALQKERRSTSVDSRLSTGGPDIASKSSDTVLGSPVCLITIGKLGVPPEAVETPDNLPFKDMASVVHEFRGGFRATFMDLHGFHIFLLTLHQKLDNMLRAFMNIIDRTSCGETKKI
ncbi:hypothetical protein L6452_09043 [Arctium lappa]|uniref:Uncharacterized protein n=1 Tax=Arctium lappa TaxID=4217 RepID=A0ACB9DK25_ARCLA|nr:hypothetical protein L6452_09043 [Arctium lappa]